MNSRFDYAILDAINNAFRAVKASPMILGATASGVGGPVGGYVGYLTQGRVSYDPLEVSASGTPESGMSLIDNLNHIRYRLGVVESGVTGTFLGLSDTPNVYTGSVGKAVVVNATEDGLEFATISGGSGGHIIQYSGVSLSSRSNLNFVGSGVTVADDAGNDATIVTISVSGGSGTPGGSDTHVQFNDGGAFGGDSDFTWNKTENSLEMGGAIGTGNTRIQINNFGGSTTQASIKGYKSGGTYASPTPALSGYILMRYGGGGYDGVTSDLRTGSITITADEDFNGTSHGTRMDFFLTPNGSASIAKVATLEADGTLSLGGDNWYSDTDTTTGGIHVSKDGGGAFTNIAIGHSWSDSVDDFTGVPLVGADRAGGTRAAPTAVLSGMGLFRMTGGGYDGTNLSGTRAQILFKSAGNWTTSSHPTDVEVYTTASGSTTRSVALTVKSDGNVNIATGKTYNIAGTPHTHTNNVLIPFGVFRGISPITANTYMNLFAIDRTYTFVKWTQNYYIETPNNGSNYWNIEIRRLSDAGVINSMTTASASLNTWYRIEDSTFSITSAATSATGLSLYCYKTGSPGALYVSAPTLEATPS